MKLVGIAHVNKETTLEVTSLEGKSCFNVFFFFFFFFLVKVSGSGSRESGSNSISLAIQLCCFDHITNMLRASLPHL
jgi:hypothetical protein